MAKKKTTTVDTPVEETKTKKGKFDIASLAKTIGGEVLSRMDTAKSWVDTGNLALNFECSGKFIKGGIPLGKLIEVWGNSSSCKTLFALNFLRGVQKAGGIAVFLDVENTLNAEFAKKAAHVDIDNVLVIPVEKADSLEKAFNQLHNVLRTIQEQYGTENPTVIIYDSIAASASEREFAETTIDMFATSKEAKKEAGAGADKPGEHAKIIGKELRKLNPVLNKANASVVFINQIREKIGVLYGSPEKKASGGRSLEYYCSLSIKTKASAKLKDDRDNVKGILVSMENTKNKCFRPFVSAENVNLFFDVGINPLGGLLDVLYKEYRIDKSGNGWKVNEPWAGGQEVTFRAAVKDNLIPVEILLKCPKLIDADSPEEIKEYLSSFGMDVLETYANSLKEHAIQSGEALDVEIG